MTVRYPREEAPFSMPNFTLIFSRADYLFIIFRPSVKKVAVAYANDLVKYCKGYLPYSLFAFALIPDLKKRKIIQVMQTLFHQLNSFAIIPFSAAVGNNT